MEQMNLFIRRLALLNISAEISEADLTGVTQINADFHFFFKYEIIKARNNQLN